MLVELLRTRRWLRRSVSGVSVLLLLGGLGLVGYPLFTNAWQDRIQDKLSRQIASPELKQAYREGKVETGDSLTRIRIPRLGVDVVVVEGITPSALRAGAGHYPSTSLPCAGGNVAIAGHRTTYGRPFGNLDQLRAGDTVELTTPLGACSYKLNKDPFIVAPTDLSVLDAGNGKSITLTTCHPKGSAAQRLVATGTWVKDLKSA
ncbi:MAG: class E sortase [Acidimicrobiales bacterium]